MSRLVAGLAAVVIFASACDNGGGPNADFGGPGGPPSHPALLAFNFSYTSATAGEVLPEFEVYVYDDRGALAPEAVEITVTLDSGMLGGTTTLVTASGVARFVDLRVTRAGGYTLVASAPGLASAQSSLTVLAGRAVSLAFDAEPPATTTAGAMLPQLNVSARDAFGNVATDAYADVTLSVQGAPLLGSTTRWLASGVAAFYGLSIQKAGAGYALSASASGGALASAQSTPFDMWPAGANRLVFGVQPAGTAPMTPARVSAGDILTPPAEVRVEDAYGNLVREAPDVTVTAPGLGGTRTVTAAGAVATFADLYVTVAGTSVLIAEASGLRVSSANFNVLPGPPSSLAFSAQPGTFNTAGALLPTVSVAASDVYGNRATNASFDVTLSLDGADLFGTTTAPLFSGVASFSGLSICRAGTGYRYSAVSDGLGPVASNAFNVAPAAANHLAFTAQPPPVSVAGVTFAPAVTVAALDAYGNVSPASGTVTLTLSSPASGATLLGTTATWLAGTASFGNLAVRVAATGYKLVASGLAITGATSDPFDVVPGPATRLAFTVPPTSILSGHDIAPPVQVAITDDWLNLAATTEREVTLALEPNAEGAVLVGTTAVVTSGHVAVFGGLTVHEPANGYQMRAVAQGLPDTVSGPFNVSPQWLSMGPDGGDITALAADPASSAVAYAATNGCVWKTIDGAITWSRACRGLVPMQIDALAVHPSAGAKLFAAASSGLYRSTDAGASWSVVASLGAAAPYRTLAVAVAASGAIYAGTFQDGLWRSDDGGATWARLTVGLPPTRITAIAIEPASTEVIYAAGVDPDEVGTVYRSVDRGDTWTETPLGPAAFPDVKPTALLVDPSSAATIFVGTQTGVYESYDRGATFTETLSGADVRDLAAYGPSHVRFAAGTAGVWRKVGGDAWAATSSSALPSAPRAVAVAVRANGIALAGTRYGVYRSTTSSSGVTWAQQTAGLRAFNTTAIGIGRVPGGATTVYAATSGGGVYRSLNGGTSWTRGSHPADDQLFYAIAVERLNPARAWLAGASGLYRTTDSGATWTEVLTAQGTIYSTALDPANDAIVYAGGAPDVFRSPNGSVGSFRDLNVCSGPMRAMALSATAPLALWVGQDAGLCKVDLASVNEIFVPYTLQPGTSGSVSAIAIDPDPALAGSTVWASTSDGLLSTVDGGASWTSTSQWFDALLAQPGKLFGARQLGTLEISRDGGATFAPVGIGLFHGRVRAIADVPGVPNEIYATTSWGSVFKTTSGGE